MLDLTVKFISVNSLIFGNNNMDIATALQIVIDLARQNVLDHKDVFEDELTQQMLDQGEAINMVEDMAVNQFGDNKPTWADMLSMREWKAFVQKIEHIK